MERQTVFRVNDNGLGPELLTQVFLERGWVEYDEKHHGDNGWHLWWRTSRFRTSEYSGLLPWQRINHFPSCGAITRKDALCRNFRKMRVVHGASIYSFSPQAYNLPNDYTKFVSEYAKHRNQTSKQQCSSHPSGFFAGIEHENQSNPQIACKDQTNEPQQTTNPLLWICKPAESSRGRGIFIFQNLSELQYDCNAVVQQYISDPLLIGGYKFDIRVYVAVPSFSPLQIYIHEEGLVRFSTEKYDLERPDNIFAHLTNTSINKFSPGYTTDKDEVGHGCKWTISQLRRYFLQNDINDGPLWHRVTNIIILTMLMQAPSAPRISNCFELYGFDILVDSQLKPWLLEVNVGPALSSDCQADLLAKKSMLHDLLDLVCADTSASGSDLIAGDGGGVGGLGLARDFTLLEESWTKSNLPLPDSLLTDRTSGAIAGLGSLESLTDQALNGLCSPQSSHRSRLTHRAASRHSFSLAQKLPGTLQHAAGSNPNTTRRFSDSEDFPRGTARNLNGKTCQQQSSLASREQGYPGTLRHRSFQRDSLDGVKASSKNRQQHSDGVLGNSSSFLHSLSEPLHTRYGNTALTKTSLDGDAKTVIGKKNLENIKFSNVGRNQTEMYSSNTSLSTMPDKTMLTSQSNKSVEPKPSDTSDSGISSVSHSSGENPAAPTTSSSRLRSEMGKSDLLWRHETNSESCDSLSFGSKITAHTEHSGETGADLMAILSQVPARPGLEECLRGGADGQTRDEKEHGDDGVSTQPAVLHQGNRPSDMHQLPVTFTDRNLPRGTSTENSSRSNTNNSNKHRQTSRQYKPSTSNSPVSAPLLQHKPQLNSLHTDVSAGKNGARAKRKSGGSIGSLNAISPRTTISTAGSCSNNVSRRQHMRQQPRQMQVPPSHSNPHSLLADKRQAHMYAIPRNFSRTEAARFPQPYHHGRHPYGNSSNNNHHRHQSVTPAIPRKNVGRFFLVFPFSETTQKLSQSRLEPKLVIREVQKHLKENIKHSSTSSLEHCDGSLQHKSSSPEQGEARESGVEINRPGIWAPLKTYDNFDF